MGLTLHEMLTDVSKAKTKGEKIKRLKGHDCPELRSLLQSSYDPSIKWVLPEGDPPYTPNTSSDRWIPLRTEVKNLYNFVKGGSQMKDNKRQTTFIQMLEALSDDEAKLLIAAKNKEIHKSYAVSWPVIMEAFDLTNDYSMRE
jgi:hypothetical protein